MMWVVHYDKDNDESVVEWDGEEVGRVTGEPQKAQNNYLVEPDIRPVVRATIQSAGTPDRIAMQTDLSIHGIRVEWPDSS